MLNAIRLLLITFVFIYFPQVNAHVVTAAQNEWPPYINDSGEMPGLAYEVVRRALRVEGFKLRFRLKPWSRAFKEVSNQKTDLLISVWYNEERAKTFLYSQPFMINTVRLVTLKDDDFSYRTPNDIRNKKVGILDNYSYDENFLASEAYTKVTAVDLIASIKLLKSGRIDMFVSDELVARWTINSLAYNVSDFAFIHNEIASQPLYIAISKSHPKANQIIEAFNQGLQFLVESGEMKAIYKRYQFDFDQQYWDEWRSEAMRAK
ncbi:transporter substrate-binding domain-containing protein [Vibrio sp. SCSIO 43135]|uniref:substrate-binding periplasmic protein n=1 Tax=Vibrio sp. SCSIO 43135 TaxID=2819096 RepID=UPI002074E458|nr:transporter substrate-binding domain-containing protein [Vibrio sp. SCSIO 43135]USD40171.1 transporter substrate-binding domain-containing protein [Vibrio sp. SCSIO 43135]